MKRSSPLLAKLAILLSLIIGTTSAYYAHQAKVTVVSTKSSIAKLEGEGRQLDTSFRAASEVLTQSVDTPLLDENLSRLLVVIMAERLPNGIDITSMLPAKNVTANEAASFEAMSEPVGGMELKGVRLNLRGTYSSYEGLLAYVAKLREMPVSVVYMKVEANAFELGLRAYGK